LIVRRRVPAALLAAAAIAGCGASSPSEDRAVATATPEECVAGADLYGAPASGYHYDELDDAQRGEAIESVGIDASRFGEIDARLARADDDEQTGLLLAVPLEDEPNALEDFAGGAAGSGKPVRREDVAGHDVRWVDYGTDGTIAVSLKGCHLVWVVAADEKTVRRLAEAVFA
jgi:hypothetical protein